MIDANADVNQADIDGDTPLYVAAQNGHAGVVQALMATGADRKVEALNTLFQSHLIDVINAFSLHRSVSTPRAFHYLSEILKRIEKLKANFVEREQCDG